jgi:hypothetical protein
LLHGRHYVRRTQIHLLVRRGAAGNQVRTHYLTAVIPSEIKESREIT